MNRIVGVFCLITCWISPVSAQATATKVHLRVIESSSLGKARPENPTVVVSPDCQHVAFYHSAIDAELLIDGVKQPYAYMGPPVFSADGQHVAYFAMPGRFRSTRFVVVLDGNILKEYDHPTNGQLVHMITFGGTHGKRIAYVLMRGKRQAVVVDGAQSRDYDRVSGLAFSPDGQKMAYAAKTGLKWIIVGSDTEGKEKEYDAVGFPSFGPNGALAFQAKRQGRQFVVTDGAEGRGYGWASAPRFSPNGKHMAYLASLTRIAGAVANIDYLTCGDGCLAVVDGVEQRLNGPSDEFEISNDGTLAYSYQKSGVTVVKGKKKNKFVKVWVAVVGGKEIVESESTQEQEHPQSIGPIFFSPDGKRFAFRLRRPENQPWDVDYNAVVIDGIEQRTYQSVSDPVFSPDSSHVVYFAGLVGRKDGRTQPQHLSTFIVIDGVEIPQEEDFSMLGPTFETRDGGLWPNAVRVFRTRFPVRFISPSVMDTIGVHFKGESTRMRIEILGPDSDGSVGHSSRSQR